MDPTLSRLWAQELGVEEKHLEDDDNFFEIGGNSINAVRLVEAAENAGYTLTVPDIYRYPELADMSQVFKVNPENHAQNSDPGPFELFHGVASSGNTLSHINAQVLEMEDEAIEDVYLCTPLQEGLMALSMKNTGSYVSQFVFQLPSGLDIPRLQGAWEKVLAESDVLRTRLVQVNDPARLFQVVVRHSVRWQSATSLDAYLTTDKECPMALSDPLVRLCIATEAPEKEYFVWTIHHAIYDRWSVALILDQVATAYMGTWQPELRPRRFSGFIKHLLNADQEESKRFWEQKLSEVQPRRFPKIPTSGHQAQTDSVFQYSATIPKRESSSITISTIIQAAWALVMGQHSDSEDVVFGMTLIGRDTPVTGITRMHGPTVATVPVAVRLNYDDTKREYLTEIQSQTNDMIPFAHLGMQTISRLSDATRHACQFQNLLVIQPWSDDSNQLQLKTIDVQNLGLFNYGMAVECKISEDQRTLHIQVEYDSCMIASPEVETLIHHFEQAISQLDVDSHDPLPLGNVSFFGPHDRSTVSKWNGGGPPDPVRLCVHQAFQVIAQRRPQAAAIASWDGELTYQQLDELSSALSQHLVRKYHIGPESLIPLCFEKSLWMPVVILAVLKAGAAFVPLDPTHPPARLHQIIETSQAPVVIASPQCRQLFPANSLPPILTLDQAYAETLPPDSSASPSTAVTSQNAAYVIFTSGTTGKPKGVVIEHQAIVTSGFAHGRAMTINESSRVLQFSSYAFDISLIEIITTLLLGGCICLPSEYERLHTLADAMERLRVNLAVLTPSAARILTPSSVPHLKTLIFGGEELSTTDLERWASGPRVIQGYGPTECSITCTVTAELTRHSDSRNIGHAVGCNSWIVDQHDANLLVPIGCVGELLIEGPILARGYLNNPSLTESLFIEDPEWSLDKISRQGSSPRRRFYKTGDIVRYAPDGSIHFLRRKDEQVKLRGHRLETWEIEHAIKSYLGDKVQVAVVKHSFSGIPDSGSAVSGEFLVALICEEDGEALSMANWSGAGIPVNSALQSEICSLKSHLARILPGYMVPTAYIPFKGAPLTTSGKLDRALLRRTLSAMTRDQVSQLSLTAMQKKQRPSTNTEKLLHGWWVELLQLPSDAIGVDDHFFQMGGDSILAIHLSSLARAADIRLEVHDVFGWPVLSQMAQKATDSTAPTTEALQPFALLGSSEAEIVNEVSNNLQISASDVSDIYPCTPLQEAFVALSSQNSDSCILRARYDFPNNIPISKISAAWEATVAANPILRTRICQVRSRGAFQVVLGKGSNLEVVDEQTYHEASFCQILPQTGATLARLLLVKGGNKDTQLVLLIHHAAYDGWSLPRIIQQLQMAYEGQQPPMQPPFSNFVSYLQQADASATKEYWQSQAAGFRGVTFPSLPSPKYKPAPTTILTYETPQWSPLRSGFTLSTALRLSWTLVIGLCTESLDVAFGVTLAGRNAPVQGIEQMTGPTITTVPLRVKLSPAQTVGATLQRIQDQATDMMPFEHTGLQGISLVSAEAEGMCRFQNLLVIQPKEANENAQEFARMEPVVDSLGPVSSCALMILCEPRDDSIRFKAVFDPQVVPESRMRQILSQFSHVLAQVTRFPDSALIDLDMVSAGDAAQLQQWNVLPPLSVKECVHNLILRQCLAQPSSPAVCAWDGDFTYAELDRLSTSLATHLLRLGVQREVFVPLCLERSRWTPVAMLGVLKAGGAFVLMDPAHPKLRLQGICHTVDASIVVCSARYADISRQLVTTAVVVGNETDPQPCPSEDLLSSVDGSPDQAAYVVFTSGSTGTPKGVVIEHQSFSTSARSHGPAMHLNQESRVLHFSSYGFDVSVLEVLTTLTVGGCICIPSELDRSTNIAGALNTLGCNTAILTPSVARLLDPNDVTGLKTLCLTGEAATRADIHTWSRHVRLVNGYGPAECSVLSTVNPTFDNADDPAVNIGRGTGACCWVVDQKCHDRLVPIGVVGELLIEGPIVGRGYLGDTEKSAAAFISPPPWLQNIRPAGYSQSCYKTGDLVWQDQGGSLHYVGRKDRQAKLRGQRIELGEVEHHLKACFDGSVHVVVEVVQTVEPERPPILAAFIKGHLNPSSDTCGGLILPVSEDFHLATVAAVSKLQAILPSFMIPAALLPLVTVPLGTTGKVDRQRLRDEVASLPWADLTTHKALPREEQVPTSPLGIQLRRLWATALGIEPNRIGMDDDFFSLGGDSLSAMRLASISRSEGLMLLVPDIFEHRQLGKLSHALQRVSTATEPTEAPSPFSLVCPDVPLDLISKLTGTPREEIVDILPVTGAQAWLLQKFTPVQFSFKLHGEVSPERLRSACDAVLQRYSILRTVFCVHEETTFQVILKAQPSLFEHILTDKPVESAREAYHDPEVEESPYSGKLLVKFTLISHPPLNHVFMVRLSHAQYDGFSFPNLIRDITSIYNGSLSPSSPQPPAFSDYVYYQKHRPVQEAATFWRRYLQGSSMTWIPRQNPESHEPATLTTGSATIPLPPQVGGVPYSILVSAAFSAILASLVNCNEVLYCLLLNTRDIPIQNADEILGPCIAFTPIRVSLQELNQMRVSQLTGALQDEYVSVSRSGGHLNLSEVAGDIMGGPSGTGFGCLHNHINLTSRPGELALENASVSSLPVSGSARLEDEVVIRSIVDEETLRIDVVTSTRVMEADTASALATRVVKAVDGFARLPHAMVSESI